MADLNYYRQKALRAEKHAMQQNEENQYLKAKCDLFSDGIFRLYHEQRRSVRANLKWLLPNLKAGLIHSIRFWTDDAKQYREVRKDIRIIRRSSLFDADYYIRNNPEVFPSFHDMAEHYYYCGGDEGRDPSSAFSDETYRRLNSDIVDINPLLHYEKYGRAEGRVYADPPPGTIFEYFPEKQHCLNADMKKQLAEWNAIPVQRNKIYFASTQGSFTCNPKYIYKYLACHYGRQFEFVWQYSREESIASFPPGIRLVHEGSEEAFKELASAGIIIENGVILFDDAAFKKSNQLWICTWHGSLGFKKPETATTYILAHGLFLYKCLIDIVISNSGFEDTIYNDAFGWSDNKIARLGHARNDILLAGDTEEVFAIQKKVRKTFLIDEDRKIVLIAPTFRQSEIKGNADESERIGLKSESDFEALAEALSERFGGDWVILLRAHFAVLGENTKKLTLRINNGSKTEKRSRLISATEYPDIQELMVAADAGVTDYSSWLADYLLTGKPGFILAPDLEEYEVERGLVYPLEETPFPVARSKEKLFENIRKFDAEKYAREKVTFLKDMECMEDGHACDRIAEMIMERVEETRK